MGIPAIDGPIHSQLVAIADSVVKHHDEFERTVKKMKDSEFSRCLQLKGEYQQALNEQKAVYDQYVMHISAEAGKSESNMRILADQLRREN